jgi:hypothetical protein
MKLQDDSNCYNCFLNEAKNKKGLPSLFSSGNNMDPGLVPQCLKDLTPFEEILVAKAHCYMQMRRVRGFQYHYTGHVVCFW